jgi:hypothetical protein
MAVLEVRKVHNTAVYSERIYDKCASDLLRASFNSPIKIATVFPSSTLNRS